MNPDTGEDAEDWFAKFEREAREAAQKREQDPDAAAPAASSPPPVGPQIANPFDAPPAAPPAQTTYPSAWDVPTQAVPRQDPEATQAMPTQPDEPTQALVPAPLRPPGEPEPGSALDSLFGDSAFREYESTLGPDPSNAPFQNRGRSKELVHVPGEGTPPPPRGFGRPQKILAGVGGGLLAIIAIIGLFLLGTRLPDLLGPAPAVATPTPTPTPTLTALPIGPVEPGTYDWDELLGGECLEPYDSVAGAWGEEYTVVDCAEPHAAQMVFRAWFPAEVDPLDPEAEPERPDFPGVEELAAQISLLCSAPGVVNLAAAGAYSDVQIQGSYPVTEEQWDADPSYYCFVSRSSGEPLTGSVAIPQVAPVVEQPAP
ncbi:hypothetical protein [Pseudolysinimonas sp.]|jgi:hypothetical protein|uniref:hypothetical protein n=1 Tax=Pseudolysinimonas sp. TaxID=2680009 RepID=UPI003783062E